MAFNLVNHFFFFLFAGNLLLTEQNTGPQRNKRAISTDLPRIVTQDGHMIIQTGTNHNITLKALAGGAINVNDENLITIAQTVKSNKQAIDQMSSGASTSIPQLNTRLSNVEQRLNNLQPSGAVQSQLQNHNNRIAALEQQVPTDLLGRLMAMENSLSQVQTLHNQLAQLRLVNSNISRRLTIMGRSSRRLNRMIRNLRSQVTTLRNLLTTDECTSNPCLNGGTCIDMYGRYSCRCTSGFQGPRCTNDVNECTTLAGTDLGCQNGATCINTIGSFRCQCTSNWHGIRCHERHDDCTGASQEELCGHGTCVNVERVIAGQPKYRCICNEGWTTNSPNGPCTEDVDECQSDHPLCSQNPPVPCINTPGGFTCGQCPSGYQGNGFSCSDMNECLTNNGGCSSMVQCTNTVGSRVCGPCPAGFSGDGQTCTWVGVCATNNGGCNQHATCSENAGFAGRSCTCVQGYVGNGVGVSGCLPQGSVSGPCSSGPCQNGAVCQNTNNGYRCVCNAGYTGQNCQTNIDECASSPCLNGASCVDRVNGYVCSCTAAYTGARCEEQQAVCGGHLSGEMGTLIYPNTPGNIYPHSVSCAWIITTSPNKIVQVTFTGFDVESHQICEYDFLQLNDGNSAASHTLGKYCGNTLPNGGQPINSTMNQMYFWFYSDHSIAGSGFNLTWTSALPVCGGHIEGQTHGSINSPGYPGNYPHNRTCVWTLAVPAGNSITFTFATLRLEHHDNCSYDFLEIRDGSTDTSNLLGRYCSTQQPAPVTTTGPLGYVKFHSDESLHDRGFHITYSATQLAGSNGCGGSLSGASGSFTSPGYPSPYQHDAQCVWIITAPTSSDRVTLSFQNFDLEGNGDSCEYDYVEIRDGSDDNAPLLGRFCGRSLPSSVTSSSNTLYITMATDESVNGAGFSANYDTACGGHFRLPSGSFSSPMYPNMYPGNLNCEFIITRPSREVITLTFSNFQLESPSGSSCNYDYVQVRDGSSTGNVLGRFCGNSLPAPVTSNSNVMHIMFVTDASIHMGGFQATYSSQERECGQVFTSMQGTIRSPGHPSDYPHGVTCTYVVQPPAGTVVRLNFSAFHLEGGSCNFDRLDIYDNSTDQSSLGRYCGTNIPPVLTSSNNYLRLVFVSDSSVNHMGFVANYHALNISSVCGGDITSGSGVITSPNYPENYPPGRQCIWRIIAPSMNQLLLNITNFQIEQQSNCESDYLEIRNGMFPSSPLVGKYCGSTILSPIISHSNGIWLKFSSDGSNSAQGFRIVFEATATGCGADLTSPSGSFISPGYPNAYPHRMECFWTISSSRGNRVVLRFNSFSLEGGMNCHYDYVEIRRDSGQGQLIGRYCGSNLPPVINSTSGRLWIKFRTDGSVNNPGFMAEYQTDCNVVLTSPSGIIESPNFPDSYPQNLRCAWVINTTEGNTINASFSHFYVPGFAFFFRGCIASNVKIYDSSTETNLIGTYCGSRIPPPVSSSGNMLRITLKTNNVNTAGSGFRLEYIINGCGGYLRTPTGSFSSPNYPSSISAARVCEWVITAPTGKRIELNISDIDMGMQESQHCHEQGLFIYTGENDEAPLMANLCNSRGKAQILTSSGGFMFVRFNIVDAFSGRGFTATYRDVDGGCGGNFSATSGIITSPNYPQVYDRNIDCVWRIVMPENRNVLLTFLAFEFENHASCVYDYLMVLDGESTNFNNSNVLLHSCGSSLPSPVSYTSSGNVMTIHMRTDGSVQHTGFKARYSIGCGGTLNAATDGVIMSPNYPNNYDSNRNCSWLITGPRGVDRITLTFTHMDIERQGGDNCASDRVAVYDANAADDPPMGVYCGNQVPAPLTTQGSNMFVQFISDASGQRSGFRALFTVSSTSCGGNFTASRGYFASPGFPNFYPANTECIWTFSVAPGNRIGITFSSFQLEQHEDCSLDYVEFREKDVNGRLLGRYCGNEAPTNMTGLNGLWMKMRSDESGVFPGIMGEFYSEHGGSLYGSSGQLASPLYPNNYPSNVDYTWTITVDPGLRIRIIFDEISIEMDANCRYDYVQFRDGGSSSSPLLGQFCGNDNPDPFTSTTNQLWISFHTDEYLEGPGFLLHWEATNENLPTTSGPSASPAPGCGGNIAAIPYLKINFTSPGFPYGYGHGMTCQWTISAPDGFVVWTNITYLDLETHSSCRWDSLVFQDIGASWRTPRELGTFCGTSRNSEPLLSTQRTIRAILTTDSSVNKTGFAVDIQAVCGGIINSPHGNISSPMYSNSYPPNTNCTWVIRVANGRTIEVNFWNNFNIAGSPNSCGTDYIKVLNGGFPNSPSLINSTGDDGKYCGRNAPPPLETSSNLLYVKFVTDESGSASGFRLDFAEKRVQCGGNLGLSDTVTSGNITSPGYPQNYPHNVDCLWRITSPAGTRLQLDFLGTFAIENHNECRFDYVEIRDGGTMNSQSLGKFCGRNLPSTIKASGNVMFVRFRTDNSVPLTGFLAQYKIADCGGRLVLSSSSVGSISSPNYPNQYENNQECEWEVIAPTGHFMTITFGSPFRVGPYYIPGPNQNCSNSDFVQIRDISRDGPVLLEACSRSIPPPQLNTSDNYAFVRFISDSSGTFTGFQASFQASLEECGGNVEAPQGVIQSPNYPGQYPHNRVCTWSITVPYGSRVTLNVESFNLEGRRYCPYDYVEIYNGILPTSPKMYKLCGNSTIPRIIESSGNTMRIRFKTDGSVSNGGFRFTYNSQNPSTCGGTLTEPSGNITSPNFNGTNNYDHNLECIWIISFGSTRPVNSSMSISFSDFRLESHGSCFFDFLEIREGPNAESPLIMKNCGNSSIPAPIISPSPYIWIRFKTDYSASDAGFMLTYERRGCGGVLTNSNGIVTSPGYPNNHGHQERCSWLMQAPSDYRIQVYFTDFELENHPQCMYDSVELFNGPYPNSPSIGKFCNNNPAFNFTSQSNAVRLNFKSDHTIAYRGFRMVYQFISGEYCGGLFHGNTGEFMSPNYPSSYPHNTECLWDINVSPGYYVSLTFLPPFDLEASSCVYDFVEVMDVLFNGTTVSLGKWCSNRTPPQINSTSNHMYVRFVSDHNTNGNGFKARWSYGCGGSFLAPTGTIVSPNFPGNYENSLLCNYSIAADSGYFVNTRVERFELEGGTGCNYDSLSFYEGNSSRGLSLGKFCGQEIPSLITSQGPMFISFKTDNSVVKTGFRLSYDLMECGGILMGPYGRIATPNVRDSYHRNANCSWTIIVDPGRIIDLRFRNFELEGNSRCRFDYLDIRDGDSLTSPLLGRYCGNEKPPFTRSSNNSLTLNFISDSTVHRKGFEAFYRMGYGISYGCGGTLNATSGRFSSLNLNGQIYENYLFCTWTIIGGDNKVIQLSIPTIQIEEHPRCVYDFIKIYDGMSTQDPLMGTYCGTNAPGNITSTSNSMIVVFFTDSSIGALGFNATYSQVDAVCGGSYVSSDAPLIITSPNFPQVDITPYRCRWIIAAPEAAGQVLLTFTSINLLTHDNCTNEYVEIRDNSFNRGNSLSTHYCGTSLPQPIRSGSNQISIIYVTTGTYGSQGFSLKYQTASCNWNYTGMNGHMFSPGYPLVYPHSADCRMLVQTPPNTWVTLYFNDFKLETHYNCRFDYLEVRNGSTMDDPVIRKECGRELPDPIFATGNSLYLRFKSDYSLHYTGFDLSYTSSFTGPGCGGPLGGINGSLTSPNWPSNYTEAHTCTWLITVPSRRIIELSFFVLNLVSSPNCGQDYVTVFDGPTEFSPVIGTYCGTETPPTRISNGNKVLVKFVSSGSGVAPGFRMTYQSLLLATQ